MTNAPCLVVDDEPQIRRAVRNILKDEFDRVLEAATAEEALSVAAATRPSLIVLDLALPDGPGVGVCQEIRKWSSVPIVVLSARHSEAEKVSLLEAGADDYITKPFSPAEFRARVRAQLRRWRMSERLEAGERIETRGLTIDLARRSVERDGQPIHLTPTEWDLLRALVRDAGKVLTHTQLFRAVWTRSSGDPQQYLRVYVAHLRRKIERDPVRPELIITEPGVGYRFAAVD
jgi:two-component system KDP operon response regulator KdpE